MPIITLLTDYGLRDSYVAEMKGAILKLAPNVTLIDISHNVDSYSVREGAFLLARSVPYFPDRTIHVSVVDPGVGGERMSIIIKTSKALLVGPDNGLLAPAAERLGVQKVYQITDRRLLPERVSDVFDGRDTFGPVAALLAKGMLPSSFGSETKEYVRIPSFEAKVSDNSIEGSVIHVDGFGNLVTNISIGILDKMGVKTGKRMEVVVSGRRFLVPYVRSFSSVPVGELLALVAGGGYLELAVNQGNAKRTIGIELDEKIYFSFN